VEAGSGRGCAECLRLIEGAFTPERPSQIKNAGASFDLRASPLQLSLSVQNQLVSVLRRPGVQRGKQLALRQEVATFRDAERYLSPTSSGRRFVRCVVVGTMVDLRAKNAANAPRARE